MNLPNQWPGPEVINLEYSVKLKIMRNDWLLADTCPQAANHCPLFLSLRMNTSFITSRPVNDSMQNRSQPFSFWIPAKQVLWQTVKTQIEYRISSRSALFAKKLQNLHDMII